MARFCTLFSGSGGNSTYIGCASGGILIDAGVSCRRIETALKDRDIDPLSIKAIFITHEHTDHISGVRVFASRYKTGVYATGGTLAEMENAGILTGQFPVGVVPGEGSVIGDMHIVPFETPHDSAESCGYRVHTSDGKKIAVALDIGCMTDKVAAGISGCDLVVIESNHDVRMLENGGYPYYLKRRILSARGHLSNESCAQILPALAESGTTRFVLGHLSRENNIPDLAMTTSLSELAARGMKMGSDFLLRVAEAACTSGVEVF